MKDYSNYYSSVKDRMLNDAKILFDIQLGSEGQEITIQDNLVKCIVRNHGNPTNEFKEERYLIVGKEIDIKKGYLVNHYNEKYIIVTDIDKDNQVYNTCKMLRCNNHITILGDNNKIIKIPCVKTNATMYGDGIYENKTMSILDGMIKITVQKNEITNKFERNTYFIFNHKNKYEISSIYTDEDSGILDIIMKEVAVNLQTDNLELNIADYKIIKHYYEIIVQENINVKVGEKHKINYVIKDNGVEITDKSVLDKMVILSRNLDIITVDNQGFVTPLKKGNGVIELNLEIENEKLNKTIQISVLEESSKNFNIEVISEDNEFTVDSLFDKTFSVVFKNNDELVSDKAIFSIRNKDSRIREEVASIKSFTDNSCVISANKKAKYGIVILKAESQSGMCKIEKEIMVKNPFS